jgi:hypothetical protein
MIIAATFSCVKNFVNARNFSSGVSELQKEAYFLAKIRAFPAFPLASNTRKVIEYSPEFLKTVSIV